MVIDRVQEYHQYQINETFFYNLKIDMKQKNYILIYTIINYILIKKLECVGRKHLNDSKAFIEYLNNLHDIYKNIEKYNSIQI